MPWPDLGVDDAMDCSGKARQEGLGMGRQEECCSLNKSFADQEEPLYHSLFQIQKRTQPRLTITLGKCVLGKSEGF